MTPEERAKVRAVTKALADFKVGQRVKQRSTGLYAAVIKVLYDRVDVMFDHERHVTRLNPKDLE